MLIFFAGCAAVCTFPHRSSKNAHMQTAKGLRCTREKSLAQYKLSSLGAFILVINNINSVLNLLTICKLIKEADKSFLHAF